MLGALAGLIGSSADAGVRVYVPPTTTVTPDPTGNKITYTGSSSLQVLGRTDASADVLVVGGGNSGATSIQTPDPKYSIYNSGGGGSGGVVSYTPATTISPATLTITVGGANSQSSITNGPTPLFSAAAGSLNPLGASGALGNTLGGSASTGGFGSVAGTTGTPQPLGATGGDGGAGTVTPFGTYGGGGGGGASRQYPPTASGSYSGGVGGSGGGGDGGSVTSASAGNGSIGTANTGGGGGGGALRYPNTIYGSGGSGGSGVVILFFPNNVRVFKN